MDAESGTDDVTDLRALLLASQRLRQAIAVRYDLGPREVVVLGHLAITDGGLTPSELARRMLTGSGTLTAVLDRLVSSGYAHRLPNPRDRRSSLVQLTPSGEDFVRTVDTRLASALAAAEAAAAAVAGASADKHLAHLAVALEDLAEQYAAASSC